MAKLIPIASVAQPAGGPMDLPRFPMLPKRDTVQRDPSDIRS